MKPLLNTTLLFLLVIGFSGGVNGQDATDFEETKHADQLSRQLQVAAPSMDQVDIILRDEFPNLGERGSIVTRVREALAKGGVPEVRRLVELGILSAIVLSVFGGTQLLPDRTAFGNGAI